MGVNIFCTWTVDTGYTLTTKFIYHCNSALNIIQLLIIGPLLQKVAHPWPTFRTVYLLEFCHDFQLYYEHFNQHYM